MRSRISPSLNRMIDGAPPPRTCSRCSGTSRCRSSRETPCRVRPPWRAAGTPACSGAGGPHRGVKSTSTGTGDCAMVVETRVRLLRRRSPWSAVSAVFVLGRERAARVSRDDSVRASTRVVRWTERAQTARRCDASGRTCRRGRRGRTRPRERRVAARPASTADDYSFLSLEKVSETVGRTSMAWIKSPPALHATKSTTPQDDFYDNVDSAETYSSTGDTRHQRQTTSCERSSLHKHLPLVPGRATLSSSRSTRATPSSVSLDLRLRREPSSPILERPPVTDSSHQEQKPKVRTRSHEIHAQSERAERREWIPPECSCAAVAPDAKTVAGLLANASRPREGSSVGFHHASASPPQSSLCSSSRRGFTNSQSGSYEAEASGARGRGVNRASR